MIKLKELRQRNGWSMKEAANQMGFAYTTYVNYEKGARDPSTEALLTMAKCYGVTINYILGEANESQEDSINYYLDMLQARPEMKALLRTVKNASKEEIEANIHFLKVMQHNEK